MARDLYHNFVRLALEKEGWVITQDPLYIDLDETYIEIDLAADMFIAAEKAGTKIAVEVKSFLGRSIISEFHTAMGQYLDYRDALEEYETDRILFLAIPEEIYLSSVFQGKFIHRRLQREQVKLIIVNMAKQTISTWIK